MACRSVWPSFNSNTGACLYTVSRVRNGSTIVGLHLVTVLIQLCLRRSLFHLSEWLTEWLLLFFFGLCLFIALFSSSDGLLWLLASSVNFLHDTNASWGCVLSHTQDWWLDNSLFMCYTDLFLFFLYSHSVTACLTAQSLLQHLLSVKITQVKHWDKDKCLSWFAPLSFFEPSEWLSVCDICHPLALIVSKYVVYVLALERLLAQRTGSVLWP